MCTIALVPQDQIARARYINSLNLPPYYMNDYTVMGFSVCSFDKAYQLLYRHGYMLRKTEGGADIELHSAQDVSRVMDLLQNNRIECNYSDIADTLYQA